MRGGVWYSEELEAHRDKLKEYAETALKILDRIAEDLVNIERTLFDKQLENDLTQLAEKLSDLASLGFSAAVAYAEKAKLLARYATAVRHRMISLGSTRGISRFRDDVLQHIVDIRRFIESVLAQLRAA